MNTAFKCGHCGRPIGGIQTWIGGTPYHHECTVGPSMPLHYMLPQPSLAELVAKVEALEHEVRELRSLVTPCDPGSLPAGIPGEGGE